MREPLHTSPEPRHHPRVVRRQAPRRSTVAFFIGLAVLASACGDDLAVDYYAQWGARCAAPRRGQSPVTGRTYRDRQGTLGDEKAFLRAWTDDLYLWYDEVPEVDPQAHPTAVDYFDELRTKATTASGKPKDQFHFTYATAEWEALSQQGVEAGYGVTWALISSRPPRDIVAAYVEPGSPASANGIRRGTRLVTVDGVDVQAGTDVDTLNGGLFPGATGEPHHFVVRDPGATTTRPFTMTSVAVMATPVQNVKSLSSGGRTVGYLTFNDHIATAEKGLADAITVLRDRQIDDLVLDLRYNGGGYLVIASQLSYMLAGAPRTSGKTFETLLYNDRHRTIDPFSGGPIAPLGFRATGAGLSLPAGQGLPALALGRVVVISGPGTCSASESVINGLRGIGVEVVLIGGTTCGKPYGFYPQDNCGTTYFSIQFQGINHVGFGDYADGFVPGGSGPSGVPGCVVPDDFTHELGDPTERRLAAALSYLATGSCPATTGAQRANGEADLSAVWAPTVRKPAWRQNRILEPAEQRRAPD